MSRPLSEGGRIARNLAALTSAQAAAALAGLISTAFLARMLGTEAFGVLGFGTALLSYFGLLVTLGTDVYGTRQIAQDRAGAERLLHGLLGFRTVSVAAVSILYILVVGALDLPERTRTVLWIQGAGLLVTACTLDFVFQGLQRMGTIAVRQVAASAMALAMVLGLVRAPDDVYYAAAAPVVGGGLAAGWMVLRTRRIALRPGLDFDTSAWKGMLKASLPIAVSQIMGAVFFYIDIVMLGFMSTPHLTGVYVGMSRILAIAMVLVGLINGVLLPVIAGAWPDTARMRARYRDFMIGALFIGAPAACAGMAFPGEIVTLLFGAPYVAGATALTILMAMALATYLATAPVGALVAWHDQRWQMIAFSAGGVFNVAANLVLIPRYGIEGAAAATLAAQLLVLSVVVLRVRRRFGIWAMKPAAALIAAAAAATALARAGVDAFMPGASPLAVLAAAAAIGAAAYFTVVAATGIVPLDRLRNALRGRAGDLSGEAS